MSVVGLLVFWAVVLVLFGKTIEGNVLDSKTGKPVKNAFVRIGNITTQTDDKGFFSRWTFMPSSSNIQVSHPAYMPSDKPMANLDLNEKLKIDLVHAGYEEMLTNAIIRLKSLNSVAIRTASDIYTKNKDSSVKVDRSENIIVYTPEAISYTISTSNNLNKDTFTDNIIIVGADPNAPGTVKLVAGRPSPVVYIKEQEMKDWIKFKAIERPDFIVPYTDKNPKEILNALSAYGNTSDYEIIDDNSKTKDGHDIITCRMTWPKDSILRGKYITYYFEKDTGNWFDIEFLDTGENPNSKPGKYWFQIVDARQNIDIDIPKDAKPYTEK
jgi:hypothetical protein